MQLRCAICVPLWNLKKWAILGQRIHLSKVTETLDMGKCVSKKRKLNSSSEWPEQSEEKGNGEIGKCTHGHTLTHTHTYVHTPNVIVQDPQKKCLIDRINFDIRMRIIFFWKEKECKRVWRTELRLTAEKLTPAQGGEPPPEGSGFLSVLAGHTPGPANPARTAHRTLPARGCPG